MACARSSDPSAFVHPAAMLIGDIAAPKDRFRREIEDEQVHAC
jgi:hypothetical protein